MTIDSLFHILRYVLPVISAVAALVAVHKKTAKWWPSVLILAAMVTIEATNVTDDLRQSRSAAEQLKRNNELLEQVIRGQYPLQNVRASYQFDVPVTLVGLQAYEEHLNSVMPQITAQVTSPKYRQVNDIRAAMIEPPDVMFCQNSPFMPAQGKYPEAARLIGALNIRVLLYRKPVRPEQWPMFVVTGAGPIQPDVEMWFTGGDRCIDYRPIQHVMILRDIGAGTNQNPWEGSGEVVSIVDLRGAQMVVGVHPRRTDQFNGQLSLDEFELFIGSLEALWLPKSRFTPRSLPNGDVAYEFVFPSSLPEILALQRRHGRSAG